MKSGNIKDWPVIVETTTPSGLGTENGNKPCFATKRNQCYIYIPFTVTDDCIFAKSIFSQLIATVDEIWKRGPGNRSLNVAVGGKKWFVRLEFSFSHILLRVLKKEK